MATLTIKQLPDALYSRLKEMARLHRRSINSEAIVCLEKILIPDAPDAEALIAEAEAMDRAIGRMLPSDLVERAKREGRS